MESVSEEAAADMKKRIAVALFLFSSNLAFSQTSVKYREEFDTLDAWKPLTFPNIDKHTKYSVHIMGKRKVLKSEANASASGIIMSRTFNPFKTPILRWRWRVENVLEKGDATRKDGDDYPLRIYVLFTYDPDKASFAMCAKYSLAKSLYGKLLPHAALNYIWANRSHDGRILSNPYTDRSQMVVLRTGKDKIGRWVEEKVNIVEDYREAFGEDPPAEVSLAIMSDTDNTGESAVGFLEYIEFSSDSGKKGD